MKKRSGLADSPFFSKVPVYDAATPSVIPPVAEKAIPASPRPAPAAPSPDLSVSSRVTDFQTSRVTESVTSRLPELQTYRHPDFKQYTVPDLREMHRVELRLTWEQSRYLDDLEGAINRSLPDLERANPQSRRITKNSIMRVLVEILRALDLTIDASHFRSERDLLIALHKLLKERFSESVTSRLPE